MEKRLTHQDIISTGFVQVGGRHSAKYILRGETIYFNSEKGFVNLNGSIIDNLMELEGAAQEIKDWVPKRDRV